MKTVNYQAWDAAILYFAVNGTEAPLACRHVDEDGYCCGKMPIAGVSRDDGCPYCLKHVRTTSDGFALSQEVLEAIREMHVRERGGK
jgi:hypothetical protein